MCCCRKTFKSVGQCKHLNHLVDSSEKREHLSRLPSSAADGRISHRTVIQSHHCRQECLWQCEMPRDKNSMAVKEIIVYKRCVKICALFSQPLFNLLNTHCRDGLKVNSILCFFHVSPPPFQFSLSFFLPPSPPEMMKFVCKCDSRCFARIVSARSVGTAMLGRGRCYGRPRPILLGAIVVFGLARFSATRLHLSLARSRFQRAISPLSNPFGLLHAA